MSCHSAFNLRKTGYRLNNSALCRLLPVLLIAWSRIALSQSRAELQRLDELDRKCEEARDRALPAIRERKIEECVSQPPSSRGRQWSRAQCERYWSDFGVLQRQRAALDLPECKEAFLAGC